VIAVRLPQLAHVNVDVEIDSDDAFLRRLVRAALMPTARTCPGVPDVGEFQAPPLRQLAAAFAVKLPRQHGVLAVLVGADNMRTQFAMASAVSADHLLLAENGFAEEGIGRAGHGGVHLTSFVSSDMLGSKVPNVRPFDENPGQT
jgi:hypothetical protein